MSDPLALILQAMQTVKDTLVQQSNEIEMLKLRVQRLEANDRVKPKPKKKPRTTSNVVYSQPTEADIKRRAEGNDG